MYKKCIIWLNNDRNEDLYLREQIFMVYCLKCGNVIDAGELFCCKCGARRNCNSEVFDLTKSEEVGSKLNENNGIVDWCKSFLFKWRHRS